MGIRVLQVINSKKIKSKGECYLLKTAPQILVMITDFKWEFRYFEYVIPIAAVKVLFSLLPYPIFHGQVAVLFRWRSRATIAPGQH